MYTTEIRYNAKRNSVSRTRTVRRRSSVAHLLVMLLVMALCFTAAVPGLGGTDVSAASAQVSGKVNAPGGACLRAHTTTSSKQLMLVSDNTGVTILREVFASKSTKASRRWYYVSVNGKKGYIRSDLVDSISYANIPATATARANYRTGPTAGMKRKGSVSKGQSLTILFEAKMKGNSHERLDTACGIDARSHPDETVMLHDTQHAVRVALAQLPAGQRHMLIMRSEGMTMAEIAAACGSTPNSVKTTICAARKKILSFIETRRIVQ